MRKPILLFMFLFTCIAWANGQRAITGKVTDEAGKPLPTVTVMVPGTTTGTATGTDGSYSLTVPSEAKVLEFSFLGYTTTEVVIGNNNILNVILKEGSIELDDVVVTSFGSQSKVTVTGAIQSIKPADLVVPSSRLSASFAGRIAGVTSFQRSGEPGADGASFYIRGISTISGVTSPLLILDGVQVSSDVLNNLDPEVIQNFSILKDASATAMYGSRGANGVMIITTKSGRDMEKPIINLRVESSFNTPTKAPKVANGVTYMNMYNEAVSGRGTGEILYPQEKINRTAAGTYDPLLYPDVDWYKELFNNLSTSQKVVMNIMGGGKKIDYFMNIHVGHETGMLKNKSKDYFSYSNNINIWRYNFQNNININITPTTRAGLRLTTNLTDHSGPSNSTGTIFGMIMESNPVDFPVLYPNDPAREPAGAQRAYIAWGGKTGGRYNSGYRNPVAEMVRGYKSNFQSNVMATLSFDQKLDFVTEGLSADALISFTNLSTSETSRSASYNQFYITKKRLNESGMMDSYGLTMVGQEQSDVLGTTGTTGGNRRVYMEAKLNYSKTFNERHNVSAMFIYLQDQYNENNAATLYTSLPYRKQGISGKVTYNYDYKYMVDLNFGYNGSENFAEGRRFGFFPGVSIAYNISREDFWKPISKTISNLKLRGSYGHAGNDQTGAGRFVYLEDINLKGAGYTTGIEMDYTLEGPSFNRYANPSLSWEIKKTWNFGFDMELFKSLNVTFDVYRDYRSGIFLTRQIPNFLGTSGTNIYGNLGEVENKGFELSLDYFKQINDDLHLSFKGTFTFARNEIKEYDEPAFKQYRNKSRVGTSISQLEMYRAERLFIDNAEVANNPEQKIGGFVMGGDIKYTDLPNAAGIADGQIDANDMERRGHPTDPEITYGFGPNIKWKKWDFGLFFQGLARTSLMMNGFHPFGSSSIRNSLEFVAEDFWSVNNQNIWAQYPRLSKQDNANNTAYSTYWLRDASFLKLKNAEIGFSHKFFRIYVSGLNLLTFSKFKLWDPEMGGGAGMSYPTQRVFNIGIQMSL